MSVEHPYKAYVETNRKMPDFLIERLHGNTWDTLYRAIEELTHIEIDDRVFGIIRDTFIQTATATGLKKWESYYLPKPNTLSTDRWRTLLLILNELTAEGPTVENVLKLIHFFDPSATLSPVEQLPLYASNSVFKLPPPPEENFSTKQYTILDQVSQFADPYQDFYANPTKEFLLFNTSTILYETSELNITDLSLRLFLKQLLDLVLPANVHILLKYAINFHQLLCFDGYNYGTEKFLLDYNIEESTFVKTKLDDYKFGGINTYFLNAWQIDRDRRLLQMNYGLWLHSISENTFEQIPMPGITILSVVVCQPDRVYGVTTESPTSLYRYDLTTKTLTKLSPLFYESDEYIVEIKSLPNGNGLLARTTNASGTKNRMYTLDVNGETQCYFWNMHDVLYPNMEAVDFYKLVVYIPGTKHIGFYQITLTEPWTPLHVGAGGFSQMNTNAWMNGIIVRGKTDIILNLGKPLPSGFGSYIHRVTFGQTTLTAPLAIMSINYNRMYLTQDKNDLVLYDMSSAPGVAVISDYRTSPTVVEKAFVLSALPSYDTLTL